MTKFFIYTDDGQQTIHADDLREALVKADLPENVTDVESFESWLRGCGGYGAIHQDDICIAHVR